jgi:hypothetical protein
MSIANKYTMLIMLLLIFFAWSILWVIYFFMSNFTRVVVIEEKSMDKVSSGGLDVMTNEYGRTHVRNTRHTETKFYIVDTERRTYEVGDCLVCGFYMGKHGKYSSLKPGDRVELKGYGGWFTGVADVYGVRRL